jgi:hypothetical protein
MDIVPVPDRKSDRRDSGRHAPIEGQEYYFAVVLPADAVNAGKAPIQKFADVPCLVSLDKNTQSLPVATSHSQVDGSRHGPGSVAKAKEQMGKSTELIAKRMIFLTFKAKFWWASRESNTAPTDYELWALINQCLNNRHKEVRNTEGDHIKVDPLPLHFFHQYVFRSWRRGNSVENFPGYIYTLRSLWKNCGKCFPPPSNNRRGMK